MASNGKILVGGDHDYQNAGKPVNIQQGSTSGDPIEYSQHQTDLATKQGNLTGGAGVKLDGDTVSVDLSTSDADFSNLTVSGATDSELNGVYTRASYEAYVQYKSGTDGDFDLRFGGDFAFFYKDNGNGTWSIVGANDTDGNANSNNQWYAVTTGINPATVTGDVNNYVVDSNPGVGGSQFQPTNSHDLDEDGKRVPTATDSNIAYGEGASDSFLAFESGKLKVQVVSDISSGSTTNIVSGGAVKTAIEEAEARSKLGTNTSFSNSVANIAGNPTNAQSMGEGLAAEIDNVENTVSGHTTQIGTINSRQSALADAVGVALGDSDMGTFGGTGAIFLSGATTAKAGIEGAAAGAATSLSVLGTVLGLSQGDTDFGGGFTILPNDADAKTIFQTV